MARKKIEIDLEQVRSLASRGLTREQVAYSLGFTPQTYGNHARSDPSLEEAYQHGKAEGIKAVANKLLEKALTGDNTAIIFYLKCNGWREENSVEVKNTTPINLVIKNDLKE
jgi:hypothetical protein